MEFKRKLLAFCGVCVAVLSLSYGVGSFAQEETPLERAQAAIARKDWAAAEAILLPLGQAQPKNPFIYYEMAQVYENTNRVEAARQIYQAIVSMPDSSNRQYAVVVRSPEKSYIANLINLSQVRLNTLKASTAALAAGPAVPPKKVDSDADFAQVQLSLQNWIRSWVNKDVAAYVAHYVAAYKGVFPSAAAWQKSRARMLSGKRHIKIDVSDLRLSKVAENRVAVDFQQVYTSDNYSDTVRKTVVFVQSGGRWLIESEPANTGNGQRVS